MSATADAVRVMPSRRGDGWVLKAEDGRRRLTAAVYPSAQSAEFAKLAYLRHEGMGDE